MCPYDQFRAITVDITDICFRNTNMLTSLLLIISFPWIRVLTQRCRVSYSIYGQQLQGHAFKRLSTREGLYCVDQCALHENCHSINIYMGKEFCELNNANHLTNPGSVVSSDGCQYLNYFIHPVAKCSNTLCSKAMGECKMDKDGLNYNCVNMSTCQGSGLQATRLLLLYPHKQSYPPIKYLYLKLISVFWSRANPILLSVM